MIYKFYLVEITIILRFLLFLNSIKIIGDILQL